MTLKTVQQGREDYGSTVISRFVLELGVEIEIKKNYKNRHHITVTRYEQSDNYQKSEENKTRKSSNTNSSISSKCSV